MKILICSQEYPPEYSSGIGNVAYNIVEQLKKKGHDCVVCSPSGPDIKLGSSTLIEKFCIAGLLYYWIRVSDYFKEDSFDFDLVWLHNPLFLLKNPFKRSLVTIHSSYHALAIIGGYPKSYYKIAAKIEKYCLNKISEMHFSRVSTSGCDELKEIGLDEKRITYIPNGVNTNKFKPVSNKRILRKRLGLSEDNLILLSVGRLVYNKQPHKLLDVFSIIEKEIE
ncbi:MAG: glycosyltransferase family 4 protein, partial [Euryarchaeota archaeon]|nr:glycosyltransferase family 4 protein [Euryarchaeota archaeon]